MKDGEETKVFLRLLRERLAGKNIFIIAYGSANTYTVEEGIRMITVADIPKFDSSKPFESLSAARYARFTIAGEDVSFEFAPLY